MHETTCLASPAYLKQKEVNDLKEKIEEEQRTLGKDHETVLVLVDELGRLLMNQGKLEEAGQMYRRAIEVRERLLGVDRPSTLVMYNHLGTLLKMQGTLDEAEKMLRRSLEGQERGTTLLPSQLATTSPSC